MRQTFANRLAALEALERAQRWHCRGWVVLDEDDNIIDPCPCGRFDEAHKAYVAFSPDDWDANEP